uniref:Choline transporter-like protein n=1 Tax=Dendroctonus ponderosae TaxID=77166 RepID=A0AAR5P590_DENPD
MALNLEKPVSSKDRKSHYESSEPENYSRSRCPQECLGHPDEYRGPLKNRSCTDVICLLIFIVFVVLWAVIGIWGFRNGDPNTLLVPKDSSGLRCGLDKEVKNYKYLFFFELTECLAASTPFTGCSTKQVCVESCPNATFYYETSSKNLQALPYCNYKVRTTAYDENECPKWFLPSTSFQKRCIPATTLFNETVLSDIATAVNDTNINSDNIITAISNLKLLSEAEQFASQVINDLVNSWQKILIGLAVALVICLIYIFMLRWIAGVMVWISIVGVLAALSAATYFSYTTWQYWKTKNANNQLSSSANTKQNIFLALFIIVAIVLGNVLLVLIFLRSRIVLAIALIKEGSRAVSSVTSVLFFPVFPWILQGGIIAYAVIAGVYLASSGEPLYQYGNVTDECQTDSNHSITANTVCSPKNLPTSGSCSSVTCSFIGIKNDAYYSYLQGINIFGFFWLAFFVSAFGQMTLAQVFAQWYWTRPKRDLPFFALTAAIYRTIRYHLGTLAFGSLIIAICRMIRVMLEYVDKKLKKYDNAFTRAILCCLKCFFWCLEKFLKFINKNAYIMCAIHGKNFCASAKDAFTLLLNNIVRVFVLDKVTDFLFFLSKLLVTFGVGAIAYVFFVTDYISFVDNSEIQYGLAPVVAIMIATYLIATLFFNVYSMAVDTLFLCFLEDSEKNNGKDRPYYMSRNLMRILGKRNKPVKTD